MRRPFRLPLIAALALAFVSLALISGIAYIAVLAGASGTAERLLVDRAARFVEAQVSLIRSRLDPVTDHLELVAALAANGRIDIESAVGVREAAGDGEAAALGGHRGRGFSFFGICGIATATSTASCLCCLWSFSDDLVSALVVDEQRLACGRADYIEELQRVVCGHCVAGRKVEV